MKLKHLELKIGDMFRIDGRICRKTGILGFVYVDESHLGEVQFSPDLDAKIEPIVPKPTTPAPAIRAEEEAKPPANKTPAKRPKPKKAAKSKKK
jgi:hypothetical protein